VRNAVAKCVQGQCAVHRCLPGWQDCDGLAATGCEAYVLTFFSNSAHCGGCGKICLAPLSCSNGKCGLPQLAGRCLSLPSVGQHTKHEWFDYRVPQPHIAA
jgi:hypothetical protein